MCGSNITAPTVFVCNYPFFQRPPWLYCDYFRQNPVPCLAHKEEPIPRVWNWPAFYVFRHVPNPSAPAFLASVFQGKNVPVGKINRGSFLQQTAFCCAKLTCTHKSLPNSDFLLKPTLHK